MREQKEKVNKQEPLKNNQTEILELNNAMTELNISIEGFNTRLKHAEERFSKLKDRSFEIIQLQEQEEK